VDVRHCVGHDQSLKSARAAVSVEWRGIRIIGKKNGRHVGRKAQPLIQKQ